MYAAAILLACGNPAGPTVPNAPSAFQKTLVGPFVEFGEDVWGVNPLTWNDNSTNEDGFRIYRSIGTGSFALRLTTGPNITILDGSTTPNINDEQNLPSNTRVRYRLHSFNTEGESAGALIDFTTPPNRPTNPQLFYLGSVPTPPTTTHFYRLQWTGSDGATHYRVEGFTGGWTVLGTVTTTQFDFTSTLKPPVYSALRVVAISSHGESAPSAEVATF